MNDDTDDTPSVCGDRVSYPELIRRLGWLPITTDYLVNVLDTFDEDGMWSFAEVCDALMTYVMDRKEEFA